MADFNTTNSNFFNLVNVDANFIPRSLKNTYYLPPAAGLIGAVKPDGTTTTVDPDGTIHAIGGGGGGGVTGLAGTPIGLFLTGNIRLLAGTNITIVEDTLANTITFNAQGGGGGFGAYVQFAGSVAGGVNQQFTNVNLGNYTSVFNMTVLVNGVGLTPMTSFNLAGTVLTIFDYLAPSSVIQVISKGGGSGGGLDTIAGLPVAMAAEGMPTDLLQVQDDGVAWNVTPAQTITDGGNF